MVEQVHIEFRRVQTWLFAVPRLRAMVGANVLLGRTLRIDLPQLARANTLWKLEPSTDAYPNADPNDPLLHHDDPASDARAGILSRDGGHFQAAFASGATAFADAATELIHRAMPGMRFRISIDRARRTTSRVQVPTELPVLAPCEWTGRGLASTTIEQGDDRPAVSLDVARRHEAAKQAEGGQAKDLANLLTMTTRLNGMQRPQELEEMVGSGYLALIHADGNNVGGSAGTDQRDQARFFHRARVLMRSATRLAIDRVCQDQAGLAPLILLMLGGDDLLVLCRAKIALPFVVALCQALADLQQDQAAGFRLTLGVGAVIAKHNIPIHRLHEVAEQLVSSAKRRVRGLRESGQQDLSVVDWAVYSTSWVGDPEEGRRRDWVRGSGRERRVLSRRPVPVLGTDLGTLQGLVEGAGQLVDAPRSQLRYLVDQLPRGRALTELAFAELSKKARDALEGAGVNSPWHLTPEGLRLTHLLDLVEIAEIARLGRSAEADHLAKEAAND